MNKVKEYKDLGITIGNKGLEKKQHKNKGGKKRMEC